MIDLYVPEPSEEEILKAARIVARSKKYSSGKQISLFEKDLTKALKVQHTIATSSGSTALQLAVDAIGWKSNDKIVTSPYGYIATTNALINQGCIPVFGRIKPNLQLDLEHVIELLETNKDVRGLILPHIFGHKCDTANLRKIRTLFPALKIIEDAAQAFAPRDYGLGIGIHSDLVTHSFHENKVLTTMGQGGAITTNSSELKDKIRSLRGHGRLEQVDWIEHIKLGYNYQLTEFQALVGVLQLKRIDGVLSKRAKLANLILDQLDATKLILPDRGVRSWFAFYCIAKSKRQAALIVNHLKDKDIQARVCPMPALSDFAQNQQFKTYDQNVSTTANRVVRLPLHTRLTPFDITKITEVVNHAVKAS